MTIRTTLRAPLLALAFGAVAVAAPGRAPAQPRSEKAAAGHGPGTVAVSGSGSDQLTTALIHSKETTATGYVQHSTEIIELTGDLRGRVLYQVTTVVDQVHGTLVNTGDEVYSGTVAGSGPVLIHDDQFRFEANLKTGAETGHVFLLDHIAGPKVRCTLTVVGTGMTPEGNPTFTYTGQCTFLGQ